MGSIKVWSPLRSPFLLGFLYLVMQIINTSEKVLIWSHRTKKTQQWLAKQFGVTKQAVSQKINDNMFSVGDIIKLRSLGCDL